MCIISCGVKAKTKICIGICTESLLDCINARRSLLLVYGVVEYQSDASDHGE
jgi:hypothetical protein